jgi:hypothetical protein
MKIIPRIVAVGLAASLNAPRKVEAVPIVIAPLICAKVCVLVGTTIVGGVTSYVWYHRQTKKKYFANIKGIVRKIEDGDYLEDPKQEDLGAIYPLNAKSWKAALRECAFKLGYPPKSKIKVFKKKGVWQCTLKK